MLGFQYLVGPITTAMVMLYAPFKSLQGGDEFVTNRHIDPVTDPVVRSYRVPE